ncbi:MAG: hypothetical protein M1820_003273 [Bogoriella megaspora]|nr:MAG: hypothetical protein M1820_003273 [Bogoriella megaspora]
MKTFTSISLATLAATAASASVIHRRIPGLELSLEAADNTLIKATLTNTGSEAVNLLNKGTFLDNAHVQKVAVSGANNSASFEGIRYRVSTTNLSEDSFTSLDAGESKVVSFDMAHFYDLTSGGTFDVKASGAIPFAKAGSTELTGNALAYSSKIISVDVDGTKAATVARPYSKAQKRANLQSDCTGSDGSATESALSDCVSLAQAAASDASAGSSTFEEYFKTTDASTRQTVSDRLNAVADECSSTTSGATDYYCTDVDNGCSDGVLAYTIPSQNVVVNCPLYFSDLPHLASSCHQQDQVTTTIHEFTHAPGVYSPGTDDLGYGYNAVLQLDTDDSVNNADTYALYANAINLGC